MKLKLNEISVIRRPWLLISMAVSFACAIIIMFCFNYLDGELTRDWSLQLLDCIFGKTDMEFYHYSKTIMANNSCDKTILMMIPISLWNIPVWVIHEITKDAFWAEFGCIVWMKIGYLICIVLIAVECYKIIKKVAPDSDALLVYPLLFGAFDIIDSTMYACQDEVIYMLTLVVALRKRIEGKKGLFLLFAIITVTLNPEMLIPVLLMTVIFEKRILRVLIYTVLTFIPSTAFSVIYGSNEAYRSKSWIDEAFRMMSELFTSDVGLSQNLGNVSLFLVVTCILFFYTYTKRVEDTDSLDILWIMGIAMTSMTLLSSGSFMNYFYRSFLYIPFMLMIILTSKNNLHTNIILFAIYSWIRGWLSCLCNTFDSFFLSIDNEFTRRVYDEARNVAPGRFLSSKMPILGNYGMFTAVCLSLAVIIFYINHKNNQDKIYDTFKPKLDLLVFVTGLFVPMILGLFAYTMINSDVYDKTIKYGSIHIAEYYESDGNKVEIDRGGVVDFTNNIFYEDNICLMNGVDTNGVRVLQEGGISHGPYITLYPGTYDIEVRGYGLDNVDFDCVYTFDGNQCDIPITVASHDNELITYTISIEHTTDSIETRFYNWTSDEVGLESVRISGR